MSDNPRYVKDDNVSTAVPVWLAPKGAMFEAIWGCDRRDELHTMLCDVWETAFIKGCDHTLKQAYDDGYKDAVEMSGRCSMGCSRTPTTQTGGADPMSHDETIAERAGYPHTDGDFTIIGLQCFADADENVISWKGANYVRQAEPTPPTNRQCHKATRISHADEPKGEAWCIREYGHDGAHLYAFMLNSEAEPTPPTSPLVPDECVDAVAAALKEVLRAAEELDRAGLLSSHNLRVRAEDAFPELVEQTGSE
jgi:hypothetical protein